MISDSVKKVLNETKWIGPNDEPIDGPDYDSIDNPSQNNLPPIDRYHPDYWYYRQEEEPYDPTYDEGYLDDFSVNNDNEFKDDLDDWGIEENKQYNTNRNINKKLIRLTESDLKQIVKESVSKILSEAYGTPSKSDTADYDNFTPYNSYNSGRLKMKPGGNVGFHETMAFKEVMYSLKNAKHYASIGAKEEAWLKNVPFEQKTMVQKYYLKALNDIDKALQLMIRVGKIYRMNTGLQPEQGYAHAYDKTSSYGGGYGDTEDRHDYSGLPGWGG